MIHEVNTDFLQSLMDGDNSVLSSLSVNDCDDFGSSTSCPTYYNFTDSEISSILPYSSSIFVLDWLEFRASYDASSFLVSLPGNEPSFFDSGDFRFSFEGFGNRFYRNSGLVSYMGEEFASIHFDNRIGNERNCSIHLKNSALYRYLSGLDLVIKDLLSSLGASYLNCTRIDIAQDGVDIRPYVSKSFTDDYNLKGERENSKITYGKGSRFFTVGTNGHKKFSFYNKTRELSNSSKHYIKDLHSIHFPDCFSDDSPDVYRCEIRLSWAYLKKLPDFDFWRAVACDYEHLTALYVTATNGFVEFVKPSGANSSRWPIVFSFSKITDYVVETFKEVRVVVSSLTHSAKIALRTLFFLACTSPGSSYRDSINSVLGAVPALTDWFSSRLDVWRKDVKKSAFLHGVSLNLSAFESDQLTPYTASVALVDSKPNLFKPVTKF